MPASPRRRIRRGGCVEPRSGATPPRSRTPAPVELPPVAGADPRQRGAGARRAPRRRPGGGACACACPALCGRTGTTRPDRNGGARAAGRDHADRHAERDRRRIATDLQASVVAARQQRRGPAGADRLAPWRRPARAAAAAGRGAGRAAYPDDEVDWRARAGWSTEISDCPQPARRAGPGGAAVAAAPGAIRTAMELPQPGAVADGDRRPDAGDDMPACRPDGALLTLVGDLRSGRGARPAGEVLGAWTGRGGQQVPEVPAYPAGPLVLVDRPGAVQTNIRLGGPALPRSDDATPRCSSPTSSSAGTSPPGWSTTSVRTRATRTRRAAPIEHAVATSRFTVAADVATEVTGPGAAGDVYELGRMSVLPVSAEELDAARQYAVGTMALIERDVGRPGVGAVGARRKRARSTTCASTRRRWGG